VKNLFKSLRASDFLGEAFSISFDKTSANFVGSLGSLDLALLIALFRAEVVPYDNAEMGVDTIKEPYESMQGRTKAQVHVRREFVRQLAIKVKNRTKAKYAKL
jgi:hypothetical protein